MRFIDTLMSSSGITDGICDPDPLIFPARFGTVTGQNQQVRPICNDQTLFTGQMAQLGTIVGITPAPVVVIWQVT